MRQVVRALGWATSILWIGIILFSVTALYSVMNVDIGFGEAQIFPSSEGVVFSLPFHIDNNGYYDISELNITTIVTDRNGTLITLSETFVPLVSRGSSVETAHNVSIRLKDIMSIEFIPLLFNDSFFDLGTFITLNFAHAIPLQMSTHVTIPWGAPFYDLSVAKVSVIPYNSTHFEVVISLSFENHAFFDITGTLQLEVYNNVNERVVSGRTSLDVPSGRKYDGQVIMYLDLVDLSGLTESGKVRVNFMTPMFVLEWWLPYG
jgi:hypothetical protein